MKETIGYCGTDCRTCPFAEECNGCKDSRGKPFGKACMIASCCQERKKSSCSGCACAIREKIIKEFQKTGIEELKSLDNLFALRGAFVNLEYSFPNGKVKLLDDDTIYLGNQIELRDGRCMGIVSDGKTVLVCTYGANGTEPELVLYRKI